MPGALITAEGVVFRCSSMSEPGVHHYISVPLDGQVECSCNGVSWCSHIDATLVAGERHMVPPDDWRAANLAGVIARGKVGPTEDWKATWRENRRWRGLPTVRSAAALRAIQRRKPLVAFTGRGARRSTLEYMSAEHGWEVSGALVEGCAYLVVPDEEASGASIEAAGRRGVPVVTYEAWEEMSAETCLVLASVMRGDDPVA
jgi:hypothetical protein